MVVNEDTYNLSEILEFFDGEKTNYEILNQLYPVNPTNTDLNSSISLALDSSINLSEELEKSVQAVKVDLMTKVNKFTYNFDKIFNDIKLLEYKLNKIDDNFNNLVGLEGEPIQVESLSKLEGMDNEKVGLELALFKVKDKLEWSNLETNVFNYLDTESYLLAANLYNEFKTKFQANSNTSQMDSATLDEKIQLLDKLKVKIQSTIRQPCFLAIKELNYPELTIFYKVYTSLDEKAYLLNKFIKSFSLNLIIQIKEKFSSKNSDRSIDVDELINLIDQFFINLEKNVSSLNTTFHVDFNYVYVELIKKFLESIGEVLTTFIDNNYKNELGLVEVTKFIQFLDVKFKQVETVYKDLDSFKSNDADDKDNFNMNIDENDNLTTTDVETENFLDGLGSSLHFLDRTFKEYRGVDALQFQLQFKDLESKLKFDDDDDDLPLNSQLEVIGSAVTYIYEEKLLYDALQRNLTLSDGYCLDTFIKGLEVNLNCVFKAIDNLISNLRAHFIIKLSKSNTDQSKENLNRSKRFDWYHFQLLAKLLDLIINFLAETRRLEHLLNQQLLAVDRNRSDLLSIDTVDTKQELTRLRSQTFHSYHHINANLNNKLTTTANLIQKVTDSSAFDLLYRKFESAFETVANTMFDVIYHPIRTSLLSLQYKVQPTSNNNTGLSLNFLNKVPSTKLTKVGDLLLQLTAGLEPYLKNPNFQFLNKYVNRRSTNYNELDVDQPFYSLIRQLLDDDNNTTDRSNKEFETQFHLRMNIWLTNLVLASQNLLLDYLLALPAHTSTTSKNEKKFQLDYQQLTVDYQYFFNVSITLNTPTLFELKVLVNIINKKDTWSDAKLKVGEVVQEVYKEENVSKEDLEKFVKLINKGGNPKDWTHSDGEIDWSKVIKLNNFEGYLKGLKALF